MAKQTKKTETAETKKEVTAEIIETVQPQADIVETKNTDEIKNETVEKENIKEPFDFENENIDDAIDASEIKFDSEQLKDSLKKIDMNINVDNVNETSQEDFKEQIKEITNITENIKKLEESKSVLSEAIKNDPANAKSLIEAEIKKTESIKNKIQQTINSINQGRTSFTGWWNGMGYDM